jgi:hypothetical protein
VRAAPFPVTSRLLALRETVAIAIHPFGAVVFFHAHSIKSKTFAAKSFAT